MTSPLPWLEDAIHALAAFTAAPPNALLLIDAQRGNAHQLARHYLAALLCLTPQDGHACGNCQSCHLISRDLHPDYFYHQDKLKIDQIRELNTQIATTPAISPRRAIYLGNIDQYDEPALNALLKTLEEPQRHSHFCLSAPNRLAVKPTIASRARPVRVPQPDATQALDWLAAQLNIDSGKAALLLARHHDNPHSALTATPLPDWQLDKLADLCRHPQRGSDFFLALENIPDEQVLDWTSAQVEALIQARQLDKPLETWQNSGAPADMELVRLHRLYAALCKNRHPARRQGAARLAVKALLLETLDPRNPLL